MLCGKLVTLHGPSVTIKREIEIVQLHLQRGKRASERERERAMGEISPQFHRLKCTMMISCRKEGGKEGGKVSRERLNASLGPSLSAQWTEFDVGAGADRGRAAIFYSALSALNHGNFSSPSPSRSLSLSLPMIGSPSRLASRKRPP